MDTVHVSETAPATAAAKPRRRRVLVIHNPTAGPRAGGRLRRVLQHLWSLGAEVTVERTEGPGHARRLAARADADDVDVVVVAGGDGTINEVVNGLSSSAPPMAVVPLGTANLAAIELGLPKSSRAIAKMIVGGPARLMHVPSANGRRFVIMAGIGFDAHVVAHVNSSLKRRLGRYAYVLKTLTGLVGFRFRRYRVVVDGTTYEAGSAVIANGRYYGGPYTCTPDARIDEPGLQVCLFLRSGPISAIRYSLALLTGTLQKRRDVVIVPATTVSVEDGVGEPVQCDGDIASALPLEVCAGGPTLRIVAGA